MMRIILLVIITFIVFETAKQDWELYWHNPGPAEYILSFCYFFLIILVIAKFLKKL